MGNINEWVADWVDLDPTPANLCTNWTTSAGIAGGDLSCFGGPGGTSADGLPGALFRWGDHGDGTIAGVFFVSAVLNPSLFDIHIGFRCAR